MRAVIVLPFAREASRGCRREPSVCAIDEAWAASPRLRVPGGFEFIAENAQIARIRAFAESLPSRLV